MRATVLFLVLFTNAIFAETNEFDIHARLFVDGRLVSTPRVLALPGESAELSTMSDTVPDKIDVRIVATDDNDKSEDGIFLKFNVYYRRGNRIIEASPAILVKPGVPTTVTLADKKGADVKLEVSAVRF